MVYNTISVAIKYDTAWIKLSIYCRITIWLGHVKKNYFRYAMLLAKYEYYCKVIYCIAWIIQPYRFLLRIDTLKIGKHFAIQYPLNATF